MTCAGSRSRWAGRRTPNPGASGSSRNVSRTAPPIVPSRSARRSARSTMRRPRATLTSHADRFMRASTRSSTRSSVSGVRGTVRITKSDAATTSPKASGPPSSTPAASGGSSGRRDPVRRVPRIRGPNGSASSAIARPMLPKPMMPRVVSRSSRPSSGCQVRSAASSRSCGRRRFTASTIISTYSAIGRLKTPRAFVIVRPRVCPAGVRRRSMPAAAEWTQRRSGARARRRSNASAASQPWRSTSTSSIGPSASPSREIVTIRDPGAAARMAARSSAR